MNGTFEDHVPGWYEVEFSQEDDFRNKDKSEADKAKYGLAYAVKFAGDAGTYYWSARTKPEDGKKYYGHVEPSSTGKSMNFRKDTPPDGAQPATASSDNKQSEESQNGKDKQITKNMVWKNLLAVYDAPSMLPDTKQWEEFWGNVELHTEMLISGNYDKLSKPAPSLGDTFRAKQEQNPPPSDEDNPDV